MAAFPPPAPVGKFTPPAPRIYDPPKSDDWDRTVNYHSPGGAMAKNRMNSAAAPNPGHRSIPPWAKRRRR